MPRHDYEKRKFIEATSVALMVGGLAGGSALKTRDVVNKAGELWDEIEHQHPKETNNGRD